METQQVAAAVNHGHKYKFEARRGEEILWTEELDNIVVNEGLNEILNKFYKGSAYTAAHYVGLTQGSPTFAAADTMASHSGWTEQASYSESVRQTFTPGTVASQSVDNSASKAVFTVNAASVVIGGGFLTTNSTKSGTTGTLIGGAAFTANRTLQSGDTLSVTVTASAATS
jgi:hypothetical protein